MNQLTTQPSSYDAVIERAVKDPEFDVDKLERILIMKHEQELRAADRAFNEALSRAEAEMSTISTNANNPQTRSRYATFARVDGEIRPIYTAHGFGVSFNTEPMGDPNTIRVVGALTNGMISRRYQIDMPIVTQGFKGSDMMTRTHATMSAVSYGKRGLLIMMFNLAIGEDDDGNARRPPPTRTQHTVKPPASMTENVDPQTGEVSEPEPATPGTLGFDGDWRAFGEELVRHLRRCRDIDAIDQWIGLNQQHLLKLKEEKPALFKTLDDAIWSEKQRVTG